MFARTLLLICAATAAVAEHKDIMDIYHAALNFEPTYLSARASTGSISENVNQARATLLPQIDVTQTYTRTESGVNGQRDYNAQGLSVTADQALFRIDLWVGLAQANVERQQALEQFHAAEQNLIFLVAERYFAALAARDDYRFARAQRTAFKRQLDQTKERFDVGLVSVTEVHEGQARYDSAVARLATAENDLEDSIERLKEITDLEISSIAKLGPKLELLPPVPASEKEWVDIAINNSPDLAASDKNAKALKKEIYRRRANHFPTIDLSGTIRRGNVATRDYNVTSRTATLTAALPISRGGSTYSQVKAAAYDYQRAFATYQGQRRLTMSETKQAFRGVKAQIKTVHALAQSVVSNRSALKSILSAYDVGTRTIVDVLDAETDLLQAQRDYEEARYNYILEGFRLKQASGTLTVADLSAINNLLIEED